MSEMRIDYVASSGLEPHNPELGLGFWSVELGEASFSDVGLVTVNANAEDYRGGGGRYYRRQFTDDGGYPQKREANALCVGYSNS